MGYQRPGIREAPAQEVLALLNLRLSSWQSAITSSASNTFAEVQLQQREGQWILSSDIASFVLQLAFVLLFPHEVAIHTGSSSSVRLTLLTSDPCYSLNAKA